MEESKSIFKSKTVWGGIVAVLAGIAGVFGYTIDPTLQASLIELVISGASLAGGAVAIFGRVKATKTIEKK